MQPCIWLLDVLGLSWKKSWSGVVARVAFSLHKLAREVLHRHSWCIMQCWQGNAEQCRYREGVCWESALLCTLTIVTGNEQHPATCAQSLTIS